MFITNLSFCMRFTHIKQQDMKLSRVQPAIATFSVRTDYVDEHFVGDFVYVVFTVVILQQPRRIPM